MAKLVRIRQDKQARNSDVYDDTKASGTPMETTPESLEEDLNNIRSQLRRIIDTTGNWFDDPDTDLASIAAGDTPRRFRQNLAGTINSVNRDFTVTGSLEFDHASFNNEKVYLNGLLQCEGVGFDYEAIESGGSGTGFDTVRFLIAPRPGDDLFIDYTPIL